jgi:DNA-binding transcriptional ArsR family regulator
MLRTELIPKVVERLKALADENRIRLLLLLRERERNVTELSEGLALGQASVSKHLLILKQVGLVESRRQGTQAIYQIRDESVFEMCSMVYDGVLRYVKDEHAALGLDSMAVQSRKRKRA